LIEATIALNREGIMKALDYRLIISIAVANEIEAYEFYQGFGEKMEDRNLRTIFLELAEEERKHRSSLEDLLSSGKPIHFDEIRDYEISQTIERPKLSLNMKPSDAIALAIKNEEDAMTMYSELAKSIAPPDQKQMFESFARMEQQHKVKLEEIYIRIKFPEVW
jgi:rubrerythrin